MSKRPYILLAGLLMAPPAFSGGVTDDPCAGVTGGSVTLPNNQSIDCNPGATTANPAPAGTDARVTAPPPPLDPIRDTPGTSTDRIRGTAGNNTGTTGTVGTTGVGTPSVGVPDSSGTVPDSAAGSSRDSTTGVTTRDSTLPTTGADGAPVRSDTGVTGTTTIRSNSDTTGTGVTGTAGTTGTVGTGSTGTGGTGSVGGTGSAGGGAGGQ